MKNLYSLCIAVLMFVTVAAQSGPFSGSTFANVPLTGSSVSWANVGNAATSDDNYATCANFPNGIGNYSDYLQVTNFNFSIPPSTVTGILVEVERSDPNQHTSDFSIRIVKGGTITGTDHSASAAYPRTDAYQSYGGNSDTWGAGPWLPSDINNPGFGVAIAAQRSANGNTAGQVDHVRITVFFNIILPIKLLSFSLQKNQASIRLNWATAEESNMDHFVIERSENGRDFTGIGSMPTRNQLSQNNYSFDDKQPLKNISYYRLKMVGATGDATYSKIIPVRFNGTGTAVSLYPVPWHRGTTLNIVNPNSEKLTVQFFNEKGQLVSSATTVSSVIPNKALATFRGWGTYKIYDENHQLTGVGKILVVD
jgi:hypothetical protein